MEIFLRNLANLVKVKTITTMVVVAVFAVLALRGDIASDNVMIVVTAVISFYFGTQHEKNAEVHYDSTTPTPDVVADGVGK